jgi:sodium-coupled neutral amino acid transporter 11
MAKDGPRTARLEPDALDPASQPDGEDVSLLSASNSNSNSNSPDLVVLVPDRPPSSTNPSPVPGPPRRQSSFAQPRPDGTPRTPNRVRFDFVEMQNSPEQATNGHVGPGQPEWMHDDDYMEGDETTEGPQGQRIPLLTDIEAPSVRVAEDMDFDPEDHLESAKPRSNMRNAFMNMANSIM